MKQTKRIMSAAVSAAMVLGNATAFAAGNDDYYAAMKEQVNSADFTMNMSMGIDELSDELRTALEIPDGDLRIDYLMNGAFNSSEDSGTMQMAMDMTMKIPGSDDISTQTYMDMDFSDMENPKYIQIIKAPDQDKYMVMDYSENEAMMDMLGDSMSLSASEDMKKLIEELNASTMYKEPEYKDGVYSVTYTEQEIKDAFKDIMLKGEDIYIPMLNNVIVSVENTVSNIAVSDTSVPEDEAIGGADASTDINIAPEASSVAIIGGADGPTAIYTTPGKAAEITDADREDYRALIEKWYGIFNDIKLFADDAVTLDLTLDGSSIKTMDMGINIDTNIYDLVDALSGELGITDEDMAEFGETVTKENSDVKASMTLSCEFSNVNEDVTVEFPEITEENSIDVLAEYSDPGTTVVEPVTPEKIDVDTIEQDNTELLPLRSFCNKIGISDDDISYDNGVVTVKCSVNGVTEFVVTIDDTNVTVTDAQGNTRTETLDSPAVIVNDRTYVTFDFASILGYAWSQDGFYNAISAAGLN